MVNPTFFFGFNDTGGLATNFGSALFRAELTLWDGANELFSYSETIHYMAGIGGYDTDCFHAIRHTYDGVLLTEHTYDIEYGFTASGSAGTPEGSGFADFDVQALSLSIVDTLGPGNPSFEQRLQLAPGVYGVPYWSMNNDGWRELKGDINGDGKCSMADLYAVVLCWGSQIGDPEYDWHCDIDGDGKISMKDLWAVQSDIFKEANLVDGSYSWYTSGGGDYNITQWLCDFDINALKGEQVTFTFSFKPKSTSSENHTRAEIYYINETGQYDATGDWVPLTEANWTSASVTVILPDDTIAIKVIIHGQPNFKAWIDDVSIGVQH
jgi:hypothetical protein